MTCLHKQVSVAELDASTRVYGKLVAASPGVAKPGYAKWMLVDPCIDFAVSTCGEKSGLDHLGFEVEFQNECCDLYGRLQQRLSLQTLQITGERRVYGDGADLFSVRTTVAACCTPETPKGARCASKPGFGGLTTLLRVQGN